MSYSSVVVEADGGSRGNPGPAAYGAVLMDATTGGVIAEIGARIGVATNNVAEYSGLIAGLGLYREHADGAELLVRMDSKLVVEQMSGRWRIKHPDMRPLALAANRLAPPGTRYTWIPRAQNSYADRLVNEALDAAPIGRPEGERFGAHSTTTDGDTAVEALDPAVVTDPETAPSAAPAPAPWEPGQPTTFVLVRHGETDHTRDRKFSGRGGSDPGLNEEGRAQARATADWLAPLAERVDAVIASPLRRTRETAEVVAARLSLPVRVEDDLAEAAFGSWDGLTYGEARALDEAAFDAWLGAYDLPAGVHGEAMTGVAARVEALHGRLLAAHAGGTVVAVSHVTPIKLLVRLALGADLGAVHRLEMSPCSVTVLCWYRDGRSTMRLYNARPTEVVV